MRVLLANSTCKVGGVSTFMLGLRSALLAQGHDCELFFFERGTMEPHLPQGCPVRFGTLADCLELLEREHFDVVHANNVDWTTGIAAVRRLGVRLIVTAHKARAGAWTYGWSAANCDAIVGVSRGTVEALRPFTDAPLYAIHNGIDTARFSPAADAPAPRGTPIVAWVGRSGSPLKGFERFAPIAEGLRNGAVRIWIIDQHGPERAAETYPDAAAALKPIAERWDRVDSDRMPGVYREIAASGGCVVSTSVREGLPLALLEAQACGCLAIVSDVPGNVECVSPAHGGLRFPLEMDPAWVARLVLATLAETSQVRARQQATAEHVRKQFSADRMATQYLEVYGGTAGLQPLPLPRFAAARARRRLSPVLHWAAYVTERLGVGYAQWETARVLAERGRRRLAADAGLAALRTSPTMFLRPRRIAHLVRLLRRHLVDHQQRLVVGRHDPGGVPRVEDLR